MIEFLTHVEMMSRGLKECSPCPVAGELEPMMKMRPSEVLVVVEDRRRLAVREAAGSASRGR